MTVSLIEVVGSQSPGSVAMSLDSGSAVMVYDVAKADLEDAITYILGACEAMGDGGLNRTLPLAHPLFPWLFADKITSIVGRGTTTLTAAETELEAPSTAQYADYAYYRLTVNYTARNYAILSDASIAKRSLAYTDVDGAAQEVIVCEEWKRFVDLASDPKVEVIEAQHSQSRLQLSTTVTDYRQYPGRVQMRLPKRFVRFMWLQVPYSYILSENSYLSKYIGYVNQFDFFGFKAGTLLLDAPKVRQYVAPFPELATEAWTSAYTLDKLCDIEIICEHAPRVSAAPSIGLTNPNFINAGHNCMPNFVDKKFYYSRSQATPDTDKAKWYPTFYSVPFELLFTDPDA